MISACGDDTGSGGAGGSGGGDTTKSTTTGPTTTGPTTTSTTTTTTTTTTNSSSSSSMTMCGDGEIDAGEDCDDGNGDADDGCAADCTIETGWTCDGTPSVCTATCGDGNVVGTEGCDDANTDADDGCAADCTVEAGWACDGMPSVCSPNCGDGAIDGMEECDDGNTDPDDGCSAACDEENGFTCTGEPSVCASVCGDGVIASDEACDDFNIDGFDGCADNCTVEFGWDCTGEPSSCDPICGDGTVIGGEFCDGNDLNGATCISLGFDAGTLSCTASCTFNTSACAGATCGNGVEEGAEECDDGDLTSGDGCSAACLDELTEVEPNEDGTPSTGGSGFAGNDFGTANPDANQTYNLANGSVNFLATFSPAGDEDIWALSNPTAVPISVSAGTWNLATGFGFGVSCGALGTSMDTGIRLRTAAGTLISENDDRISGADRCSQLSFLVPPGQTLYLQVTEYGDNDVWAAPGYALELQVAPAPCGDGAVLPGEICDDGNTANGDGCSSTCAIEPGFVCSGSPSDCVAGTCADPLVVTGNNFAFAGTNINQYLDDANFNAGTSCVDASTTLPSGFDLVFRIDLAANETMRVRELGGLDSLIHILSGGTCGAGNACAASSDSAESTGITYTAAAAGPVYFVVESYGNPSATTTFDVRVDRWTCGDGVVSGTETCDDGNATPGDGCSNTCTVEANFLCEGTPSSCFSIAGCTTAACLLGPCTGGTIVTGSASGLPVTAPDALPNGGTQLPIAIASAGTVRSMAVGFDVTTTYCSDTNLYLTGPNGGSEFNLCTGNGSSSDNFVDTFLRDGVATSITAGTAPFTGVYRPEQAFSGFTGQPVNGNWTFRIADSGTGDAVTLTSLDIAICVNP